MERKISMILITLAMVIGLSIPASAATSKTINVTYEDNNVIVTMDIGQEKLRVGVTNEKGQTNFWPITTSPAYIPVYENGQHVIKIYENIKGTSTSYKTLLTTTVQVSNLQPFLGWAPNVNPETAKTFANNEAVQETMSSKDPYKIFEFVSTNLTYDKDFKDQNGYMPDLDAVWSDKTGICYDYASAVAFMLRSNDIPCKIVAGYAENEYHAWNEVFIDGKWVFIDACWGEYGETKYTRTITSEW